MTEERASGEEQGRPFFPRVVFSEKSDLGAVPAGKLLGPWPLGERERRGSGAKSLGIFDHALFPPTKRLFEYRDWLFI